MKQNERRSKLAGLRPGLAGASAGQSISSQPNTRTENETERVTVVVDREVIGRARAAWLSGLAANPGSFSAWVVDAIAAKTALLEDKYNGGESFVPVPKGQIPKGPIPKDY